MSKGTPHRPIRIPDWLWKAVRTKAAEQEPPTTASEVIRKLLKEWVGES